MALGASVSRKLALAALVALSPAAASAEIVSLRVASARASPNDGGTGGRLNVMLTDMSAQKLAAFTEKRVGLVIEVRVGGKPVAEPRIAEPIYGGALQIAPIESLEEANAMAEALSQGKATLAIRDKE